MARLLDVLRVVCVIVGALTLWVLVTGALASLVIRGVKRRRSVGSGRLRRGASSPRTAGPRVERRAQTWDDVPSWVARDRRWAVAVVLLGSPEIAARTHPFVDFSARRIDWVGLVREAGGWPRRERLLVAVAHDLAGAPVSAAEPAGRGSRRGNSAAGGQLVGDSDLVGNSDADAPVPVAALVTDLDQVALDRVHAAVDLGRGTVSYDEAVERSGGLG